MSIDLYQPQFTQKQVAACTLADVKTIDNYVQHDAVRPYLVEGRRLFSAFQMIEIHIIAVLAAMWKIPPKTGWQVARQMLQFAPANMLERDAALVKDSADWVYGPGALHRSQVGINRGSDGTVTLLKEGEGGPFSVDLVVPVQTFARHVLRNVCRVIEGAEPVTITLNAGAE